ncbi:AMP-binding protein [Actinomadura latina]|uniref:AMP-binding protein n=2 Tax=Actinomadura latina TaxID=163603 RepID=A0A846ZE94_9ACTN|nr:AMP-binding protein [Actinomadura latina]
MDEPAPDGLHGRFLRGLALAPDGTAIRAAGRRVTYAQAHELALNWAGTLAGREPEAVGVLAGKSPTAYIGVLAALYAGAAVVPLRPGFPARRNAQMLAASGASVLVADRDGAQTLDALAEAGGPAVRAVPVLAPDGGFAAAPPFPVLEADPRCALPEPRPAGPADPAFILFTSGSTGRPKGVVITHGNTGHYFGLLDARYDFGPRDVFSQAFDLNFDCALFDMFCAWGAGAAALPIPPAAYRDLPGFLADNGVTVWFSTPSAIDLVRRMGGLGPGSLPGLRWSFFAGEAFRCRDARDWQAAAPGSAVENLYGPTELTVTIAAHRWAGEATARSAVNGVVPIGAVHAGHRHLLLGDDGERARDEGELCVAGPQLARGYLDPADEDGRFLDLDGHRWYRTGDRVRRIGAGTLAYLGRLDSQIQVRGWRIELAEVEHALREAGLPDAVAVGADGPGGTAIVAFHTGPPVAAAEIVGRLRRILPDGAVPRHFRRLPELPLNANRKTDRAALAARAAELLGGPRG